MLLKKPEEPEEVEDEKEDEIFQSPEASAIRNVSYPLLHPQFSL